MIVPVSADSAASGDKLRAKLGLEFPLYSDRKGAASQAWRVYDKEFAISRSATFVITRGGKVVLRHIGGRSPKRSPDAIIGSLTR